MTTRRRRLHVKRLDRCDALIVEAGRRLSRDTTRARRCARSAWLITLAIRKLAAP
jgi:hypothetical protein